MCVYNSSVYRLQVRNNYFGYLKNLLRANASVHDIKFAQVQCYAQQIEIWALRNSINSTVYREEMLKGIKTMKKCHELNLPFTHISLDEYTGKINILGLKGDDETNDSRSTSRSSDISCDTTDTSAKSLNDVVSPLFEMPSAVVKKEVLKENLPKPVPANVAGGSKQNEENVSGIF